MLVVTIFIKPVFRSSSSSQGKEDQLEGTIRLIFQPAEEISEGASDVLATGLLEDVQGIIGFHNMPQLKAGQLALNAGAMMAGVEKFKVTVTGLVAMLQDRIWELIR